MTLFILKDKTISSARSEDSIGCISVYACHEAKEVYFSCFNVDEEFQSQGFGKILLNKAILTAKETYPSYNFVIEAMPSFCEEHEFAQRLKRLTRFYLKAFQEKFKGIRLIPNSTKKENLCAYTIIGSL